MGANDHYFLKPAIAASVDEVAAALQPGADPAELSPAMAAFLDLLHGLRVDLDAAHAASAQQATVLNQQSLVIQQQQTAIAAIPQVLATAIATNNTAYVTPAVQAAYQAIVGASSAQGLYTLQEVFQHLASDETGAAQLLAQQNADRNRFAALEPLVSSHTTMLASHTASLLLKAAASDLASLTATVSNASTGLAATYTLAANALPLTGGTLTGALNVLVPAAAANPLQYSSLPFSMTFSQALPLIAPGGTYSFAVTVANAAVGQVVVLNVPPALLGSFAYYSAAVTAPATVTVTLKAGVAIAAGSQTFYLRVFR